MQESPLQHEPQPEPPKQTPLTAQPRPAATTQQPPNGAASTSTPNMHSRVTAEEFIAAINTLEARKNEEAKKLAGTVDVEETIRDLGIDASPDELIAEVQAQRAKKLAELKAQQEKMQQPPSTYEQSYPYVQPPPPTPIPVRKGSPQGTMGPVQTIANATAEAISERSRRRRWSFGPMIGLVAMVWFVTTLAGGHLITDIQNAVDGPPDRVVNIAQMADGQTAYVDTGEVKSLITNSADATGGNLLGHTNKQSNSWPIFKENGEYYLKGYVLSEKFVQPGNNVKIYNDDDAGDLHDVHEDTVTIPLGNDRIVDSWQSGSWSELTINNIHPDGHLTDGQ